MYLVFHDLIVSVYLMYALCQSLFGTLLCVIVNKLVRCDSYYCVGMSVKSVVIWHVALCQFTSHHALCSVEQRDSSGYYYFVVDFYCSFSSSL